MLKYRLSAPPMANVAGGGKQKTARAGTAKQILMISTYSREFR